MIYENALDRIARTNTYYNQKHFGNSSFKPYAKPVEHVVKFF